MASSPSHERGPVRVRRPADAPGAPRFVLQWHVTERCNLRCTHCYQEGYAAPELGFDHLLAVVEQFKALLADRRRVLRTAYVAGPREQRNPLAGRGAAPVCEPLRGARPGLPVHGHINVTGGEPLVRDDFLDLLEVFRDHRDAFTFAVLTNGTLIDERVARRLRELGAEAVQVSLEGGRSTNDAIRGAGSFDRIVGGLRHLVAAGVPAVISFTAQRSNYREFTEVARLGRELGVARVWADRLIPCGSAGRDEVLSPEETRDFFEVMSAAHAEAAATFCRTEISMARALQFLVAGGRPYHCAAGNWLLAVQANGDVLPCRRMPIVVGNVLDTPLAGLYDENQLLRDLRDAERVSKGCEACAYARRCGGGLRCLAYALTGDPFTADPGCWCRACPRGPL